MPLPDWVAKYNKSFAGKEISLVVLIIPARSQVSYNEKLLYGVVDEAFKSINAKNIALVVNKASKDYKADKALKMYEQMRQSVKTSQIPTIA